MAETNTQSQHPQSAGSIVPSIFTVFVFAPVPGKEAYKLNVHLVAGLSSADAEKRITELHAKHLEGERRLITTDHLVQALNHTTRLYATDYFDQEDIAAQDLERLIKSKTTPQYIDGERVLGGYREF